MRRNETNVGTIMIDLFGIRVSIVFFLQNWERNSFVKCFKDNIQLDTLPLLQSPGVQGWAFFIQAASHVGYIVAYDILVQEAWKQKALILTVLEYVLCAMGLQELRTRLLSPSRYKTSPHLNKSVKCSSSCRGKWHRL